MHALIEAVTLHDHETDQSHDERNERDHHFKAGEGRFGLLGIGFTAKAIEQKSGDQGRNPQRQLLRKGDGAENDRLRADAGLPLSVFDRVRQGGPEGMRR